MLFDGAVLPPLQHPKEFRIYGGGGGVSDPKRISTTQANCQGQSEFTVVSKRRSYWNRQVEKRARGKEVQRASTAGLNQRSGTVHWSSL
jgi:hypothetical protein